MTRVLDVGNCDPDHGAIRAMLERHFDATVERVMFVPEALRALASARFVLVLVNRLIFADDSPGLELVQKMKADAALAATPVMLISNFADAQAAAVAAGTAPGFGKAKVGATETVELLAKYLPRKAAATRLGSERDAPASATAENRSKSR